jgi:hypothetical protein
VIDTGVQPPLSKPPLTSGQAAVTHPLQVRNQGLDVVICTQGKCHKYLEDGPHQLCKSGDSLYINSNIAEMRSQGPLSILLALAPFVSSIILPRQANSTTGYQLQTGPLDTPWTAEVGTNPWPEHPRPRVERAQWKNLNGVWRWRNVTAGQVESPPTGQTLERSVLIPSCLESALSGTHCRLHMSRSWSDDL